jgi:hypothetical protein
LTGIYKLHQKREIRSVEIIVDETSLQREWQLAFEAGRDTPESIQLDELKSLTEHENEAVKHYLGMVTYSKTIEVENEGQRSIIDLCEVANNTELWCNGKKLGTRWAPPYTFDLSEKLRNGKNQLEVKVTNTWRNQLVFDNARPKGEKRTWTINPPQKTDIELEPSGLIEPIVLITIK